MKLNKALPDRVCRVIGIAADAETKKYLSCMGLRWGTKITVISRATGGSILVGVRNRRIALGSQVAAMITVMEL